MRKDLTVSVDAWGNIIVAGPVAVGSSTTFVAKLDKDGTLLWHETLSHGDLFESAATSVPPPAPERDSVEPLMMDAEIDAYQHRLGRQSRIARWLGAAFAFAGLFMLGIAGGAAVSRVQGVGEPSLLLAHSGVEQAVEVRVDQAVESFEQQIGAGEAPMDKLSGAGPAPLVSEPEPMKIIDAPAELMIEPPAIIEGMVEISNDHINEIGNVVELRAEVLALLEAGRFHDASEVGELFVTADSTNAFAYLCLGAALQDLGKGAEARAVYDSCVRDASVGDIGECMALGGRK